MLDQRTKMAQQFVGALPFTSALQMQLEAAEEAVAEISMPYNADLIGDPDTQVIHGGAVSALMDTCMGTAVFLHPKCAMVTATIDLRIDYMRSAPPGERITTRAEAYHVTRSVAFVRAVAFGQDRDRHIATANGAFTFAMNKAG